MDFELNNNEYMNTDNVKYQKKGRFMIQELDDEINKKLFSKKKNYSFESKKKQYSFDSKKILFSHMTYENYKEYNNLAVEFENENPYKINFSSKSEENLSFNNQENKEYLNFSTKVSNEEENYFLNENLSNNQFNAYVLNAEEDDYFFLEFEKIWENFIKKNKIELYDYLDKKIFKYQKSFSDYSNLSRNSTSFCRTQRKSSDLERIKSSNFLINNFSTNSDKKFPRLSLINLFSSIKSEKLENYIPNTEEKEYRFSNMQKKNKNLYFSFSKKYLNFNKILKHKKLNFSEQKSNLNEKTEIVLKDKLILAKKNSNLNLLCEKIIENNDKNNNGFDINICINSQIEDNIIDNSYKKEMIFKEENFLEKIDTEKIITKINYIDHKNNNQNKNTKKKFLRINSQKIYKNENINNHLNLYEKLFNYKSFCYFLENSKKKYTSCEEKNIKDKIDFNNSFSSINSNTMNKITNQNIISANKKNSINFFEVFKDINNSFFSSDVNNMINLKKIKLKNKKKSYNKHEKIKIEKINFEYIKNNSHKSFYSLSFYQNLECKVEISLEITAIYENNLNKNLEEKKSICEKCKKLF